MRKRDATVLLLAAALSCSALTDVCAQTVGQRLWIWGHPAGVYNDSYLKHLGRRSAIEPVAGAELMRIKNMIFVCYGDNPQPPFVEYYCPFEKLDRVYWSLVAAIRTTRPYQDQAVGKRLLPLAALPSFFV